MGNHLYFKRKGLEPGQRWSAVMIKDVLNNAIPLARAWMGPLNPEVSSLTVRLSHVLLRLVLYFQLNFMVYVLCFLVAFLHKSSMTRFKFPTLTPSKHCQCFSRCSASIYSYFLTQKLFCFHTCLYVRHIWNKLSWRVFYCLISYCVIIVV